MDSSLLCNVFYDADLHYRKPLREFSDLWNFVMTCEGFQEICWSNKGLLGYLSRASQEQLRHDPDYSCTAMSYPHRHRVKDPRARPAIRALLWRKPGTSPILDQIPCALYRTIASYLDCTRYCLFPSTTLQNIEPLVQMQADLECTFQRILFCRYLESKFNVLPTSLYLLLQTAAVPHLETGNGCHFVNALEMGNILDDEEDE